MSPLFSDPRLSEQIVHYEETPPRDAEYADLPACMHPLLRTRLAEIGVERLYRHQAEAYNVADGGSDLVVTTGTNSGKTLCYNLPALQMCLTEPAARCLYLFPTKALAHDQLGRLETLNPSPNIRIATYDGDTPKSHRSAIRKTAHIVLTNPDMLHVGLLPGHENWARFLKSLRLIAIDEMHVYRGVFGSHIACVLQRLLRLCEWHHARPQIVACSATIGNPSDLFERLTGRTGRLVDSDGSPSGKRTFIFWNPPAIGPGKRLSPNSVTSEILASLTEAGQRVIAFNRSRVSAELVLRYTRQRLKETGVLEPMAVESYRAGYTVKERRHIEKGLFSGKLRGLSATNAMELGVDVGGLDAVIMNGYPGTVSSFWQQSGRAGRSARDGIAIMVAHDDPLEQYLVRQPSLLLEARNEQVALNPQNAQILGRHLLCAAHERPLAVSELEKFGNTALEVAEGLDRSGELTFRAGYFFYPAIVSPALDVNLRGSGGDQVRLLVDGQELGSMERWRAMTSAHEGAIYLHRGETFLVTELDLDAGTAQVEPASVDFYTQAVVRSSLDPQLPVRTTALNDGQAGLAGVTVTDMVEEFRRKSLDGDGILSVEPLDLPPITYDTVSVRFDLPMPKDQEDMNGLCGAIHGMEHALMAVAPLLAGCDRADLGSAWYAIFPDTMRPALFVFDRTPGGVGLCDRLFESVGGWLSGAYQLVASCPCEEGCPGCLLSARCECGNEMLDKNGTLELLKAMTA